jgi:hypothetical protein
VNEQQRGPWSRAIAHMADKDVCGFWRRHAWLLVGLGAIHVAAVVCCDVWAWFPHWPVYLLTAALVFDAVLHHRINRAYENEQIRAWKDLLALADCVEAKAQAGAAKSSQQPFPMKPVPKGKPSLRVFRPDESPSQNGSL